MTVENVQRLRPLRQARRHRGPSAHCARCRYALAHRPARDQCPGCGQLRKLDEATGKCVLCSRACVRCGGKIGRVGRDICSLCLVEDRRAAAQQRCPRCGKPGRIREATGWCGHCSHPGRPPDPDHACRACGLVTHPGRRRALPSLLCKVPAPDHGPGREPRSPAERPAAVAAGIRGLPSAPPQRRRCLPDDHRHRQGPARRRACPPAVCAGASRGTGRAAGPGAGGLLHQPRTRPCRRSRRAQGRRGPAAPPGRHPRRPAAGCDRVQRARARRTAQGPACGTRPPCHNTIEGHLTSVRDLAQFISLSRGIADWATVSTGDVEAFLATPALDGRAPAGRAAQVLPLRHPRPADPDRPGQDPRHRSAAGIPGSEPHPRSAAGAVPALDQRPGRCAPA